MGGCIGGSEAKPGRESGFGAPGTSSKSKNRIPKTI